MVKVASSGFFNWLVWNWTTRPTPSPSATKFRADFLYPLAVSSGATVART